MEKNNSFKKFGYIVIGGLAGVGFVGTGLIGIDFLANKYLKQTPKLVKTIDGYSIIKSEDDGSTTIYTHSKPFLFSDGQDKLYLGLDNGNDLDDLIILDTDCDGKVDVLRTSKGVYIRGATTVREWLNFTTGTKESFERADKKLAQYKKEFAELIKQAEKPEMRLLGDK